MMMHGHPIVVMMPQRRMMPNVINHSALSSACEKGKQPEGTLQVFEIVRQIGVVPDVVTYSALISACVKG